MSDLIQIQLNGIVRSFQKPICVSEMIVADNISGRFIVVINTTVLPRLQYASTYLNHGDQVDIMSPISGG